MCKRLKWVKGVAAMGILALMMPTQGLAAEANPAPEAAEPATAAPPQGSQALNTKPTEAANQGLPSWFKLSGEFRTRGEGRTAFGFREGNNDGYGLTRLRLNIDVRPTSWMQFFVQGQDSRVHGIDDSRSENPIFKDPFDIRQAYVSFGNREDGWVSVTAGRQLLVYGSQRLVGALDWTNTSRSFDAVKLQLGPSHSRVDVFSASVVAVNPDGFDRHRDGQNLHGIYGSFKKVLPKSVVEPFVLLKTNPRVISETGAVGDLDVYTGGMRVASQPGAADDLAGVDYNIEVASQWGNSANASISAWAATTTVGYTMLDAPMSPRFSAEYSFASGDENPADGRVGTFDQLYPTAHLYYGYTDNVGWKNVHNPRVGFDFNPHRKLKVKIDYHWFWLANPNDHLYNAGSRAIVRAPSGGAQFRDVGTELDITFVYKVSKVLTVGGGFGHLFPGRFLETYSPGSATTFPYAFLSYKF